MKIKIITSLILTLPVFVISLFLDSEFWVYFLLGSLSYQFTNYLITKL